MNDDLDLPPEVHDEDDVELASRLEQGAEFKYRYDFGDDWDHKLVVESVLAMPKGTKIDAALCLDGARACPPDDCGGTSGYEALVKILGNKAHREHDEMRDWVGDWDAEVFSVDLVNQELG